LVKTLEGHTGDVNSVVFNPGGSKIVSGGNDGTVKIWDLCDPGLTKSAAFN